MKTFSTTLLLLAVTGCLFVGCGAGAPTKAGSWEWVIKDSDAGFPDVHTSKVTGNIVTAGSSTVFPLSEAIAQNFKEEGFKGNLTIDSIGSGAGFERFCVAGETDIANASRPIKSDEIEQAKKIGRDPIAFRVGTDGLAVCVSTSNTFLANVTKAELAIIFSKAEKWSDVNPAWPSEKILRFIPGTDSGTFDYFVEVIYKNDKKPVLSAQNLQLSEDDNILVQGIKGSPYAVGFFGYAYYEENKNALKVVSVEGIEPSVETVNSGKYPLARPLFLYSDATIMKSKPQVAAFIAYYLNNVNSLIRKVGYFPVSETDLKASREAWLKAVDAAWETGVKK